MNKVKTTFTTLLDENSINCLMTGDESFEIYSQLERPVVNAHFANTIIKKFKGLNRHYSCLDKAVIAARALRLNSIVIGSLYIDSIEKGVNFGFEYNPPLEFHAWLSFLAEDGEKIIDFALPGVIEKGSITADEKGFFLVGRKPVILAGNPAPYMHYKPYKKLYLKNEA